MKSLSLCCVALSLMLPHTAALAQQPQVSPQLQAELDRTPNTRRAKNVILFVGDGMGINSVTAGRVLAGQARGLDGATYQLTIDTLPYTGLSKTYSVDSLVTDSANGISAITTGVKTINGAVGVDGTVKRGDCMSGKRGHVETIFETARRSGMATGVVTTSGLTDATPAGAYGHVTHRNWRSDVEMSAQAVAEGCIDLARQMVEAPEDIRLNVALGGDRARFVTTHQGGKRTDRDLSADWARQDGAIVVTDRDAMLAIDPAKTPRVLGLFADENLPSVLDHKGTGSTPTLADMTGTAIAVLSRNEGGFFLMVESASIDKWHHDNKGYRALTDVDELDKAVQVALNLTNPEETLIIVTADHSHGLSFSGGAARDVHILSLASAGDKVARDGHDHPRLSLSYASGPGWRADDAPELSEEEVRAPDFRQPALMYMNSAQHTGEDVPVYAAGPFAHLLSRVIEPTFIYEVMRHAISVSETRP